MMDYGLYLSNFPTVFFLNVFFSSAFLKHPFFMATINGHGQIKSTRFSNGDQNRKANQWFPRANLLGTRHGYGCAGQRGAKQFDGLTSPKKPIRDEETKTSPGFGLGILWKKQQYIRI